MVLGLQLYTMATQFMVFKCGLWFVVMEFIIGTLQMFEEMWFLICNFGKHYCDFAP
jgi:hypothetical protein